MIKAIKRIGNGVRAMGLGSVVRYNPQGRIDEDHRSIHSTFFLTFQHDKINSAWHPGITFYWDKAKELGLVGTSNLVWSARRYEHLPLNKMERAMFNAAEDIVKDLKRQLNRASEPEEEAWSVVTTGENHGYATDVEVYPSKAKAEAAARNQGNCYVVKGTQMWNEPLGQVEEHDRPASYKFFK